MPCLGQNCKKYKSIYNITKKKGFKGKMLKWVTKKSFLHHFLSIQAIIFSFDRL